ncbi:CehA/McbA family metallohydrolase [Massilia forsythiae]|uniref:CehA/McbA family metallohydrolase n=1 Tax=Massilia forsythiae TaxID=2728020 RepID=A0A7Z2VV35_9BURK|nr:CehA/McbA family metallohydrolase [Massilia forsythiae]QJD99733.1 CehA/McbA family metallohydrolase [Massilia forsythiae]
MKTSFLFAFFLSRPALLAAASLLTLAAGAAPVVPGASAGSSSGPAAVVQHEHSEFEATLLAPYAGDATSRAQPDARTFTLSFEYPGLAAPRVARWQLDLLAPSGRVVATWQGALTLTGQPLDVTVRWPGLVDGRPAAPGIYRVRMGASTGSGDAAEDVEQSWDIGVGAIPAPALPAFQPLPTGHTVQSPDAAPAPSALPYTVYYGNLHSQTGDSDGGAPLSECKGAQEPQSAPYGPAAAYPYARDRGLDFLMVSEHNHMYDGSDGTKSDADPAKAKRLYHAGLQTARDFSAANPGFLALYGLEWGVISKGGHLNIFNTDELLGWEQTAKGDLLADTATARGDYAALYTLMRQRGWVGQFNHPATGGQFVIDGKPLAYTADGDAAMALCEVMNSAAFSNRDDESETRRSNFEQACNKLLEAGYHVAFSSNQDNHCANWGASYSNRSAVLVPNGVPLTRASFLDALRARRVFATMDKHAQLVLTANGRLMGERFDNSGPLSLQVHYASDNGRRAASVALMQGVPGRNGTVTPFAKNPDTTFTPTPGPHFYYAKVTQDDGAILWSAPVWVDQHQP